MNLPFPTLVPSSVNQEKDQVTAEPQGRPRACDFRLASLLARVLFLCFNFSAVIWVLWAELFPHEVPVLKSQPAVPQNVTLTGNRAKRGSVEQPLVQCDWCPYNMRKFGHRYEHARRVEPVKTEGEDSHVQAKERGLSGNELCGHRNLRLPAS